MNPTLNVTIQDGVKHITINRPKKRNALNRELIGELKNAFQNSEDCRVVLFSGAGTEAFCAGADLKELAQCKNLDERIEFFAGVGEVLVAMQKLTCPIVAKVHGYALAGGCGLAAACDIVLAAPDAVFGLPEPKIGIAPMIVMFPILRALGPRATSYLTYTAENIDAQRALNWGLVTEIIAKDKLDQIADKMTKQIAAYNPKAIALARKSLLEYSAPNYVSGIFEASKSVAMLSLTEEAKLGVDKFLSKVR